METETNGYANGISTFRNLRRMNNAGFRKKFLDGVAQGAGLFFAVAFLSFAYAAASLGNLPSATG